MAEPVSGGEDYDLHRQLAVINTNDQNTINDEDNFTPESKWIITKFTLPKDWFVENVPRRNGSTYDKYYHDPETGRKFRSLKDVERYLTEGSLPTKSRTKRLKYHEKHLQNPNYRKKIISNGKMIDFEEDKDNQYQLVNVTPTSLPTNSPSKLPDGWIVEEVPRRTGYHIDRYYYEPGTGRKFRSLPAVRRHLAELEENSPLSVVLQELREDNLPLSKAFKLSSSSKNHGSWKKSRSKKEQESSFSSPPSKINWVIGSSRGETWNAFVGDTLIQDSLKQQWGMRFMLAINNSKHKDPTLG